ncbi:MAG TPA: carboxypeptidase-like regulatory domain-containing protein [Terracidiphilus sp.]|nr:carboxypeptidase-like regulatory domain-containing protein [Terracidiphilus sp.]
MGLDRNTVKFIRQFGCLILACACLLSIPGRYAFAQVTEGSISGTVQDATGAVIPNAQVTLLNTDQGITLQTKSSGSGAYTFSPVRAGHYTLSVTAPGFQKTTQNNLVVNVAQSLQVNVQLKLGSATETVEVTTAPPQLQTQDASIGQTVGTKVINDLPLNGRNFTFLAQLGAGMQTPQADTRGNAASGAFSANGLRPAQNNYLLDGIDNNSNAVDFLNGTNFVILPPLDAISEFKVQTADFSAELGRSAGAVLNATIKSGTNSVHGAVWEFFRNDKMDAADWFENNGGRPKGALRQNQFGASGGGPIIKNKIFWFGDYEGFRRVQGTALNGSVPSALERSSGFSNLNDILTQNSGAAARADILGRLVPAGTVLDPATTRYVAAGAVDPVTGLTNTTASAGYVREPFSNGCTVAAGGTFSASTCALNQIPAGRIDANAVKLLSLFPAPNSGLFTYTNSPKLFEHKNAFDVRGDINPDQNNQIFVRFSYADDPQFIPGIFGGVADGGAFQQGLQTAKSDQAVAGWTHVFNPKTINQVRAGFAHLHTTRYGPVATTMGIPAQYGIQGIPQLPENGGLPALAITGLATLGSNNYLPSDEVSQTLQVTDDFTRILGKHTFKAGIELQRVKFSTLQPASSHGQFTWNGTYVDIPNVSNTTGGVPQILLQPQAAPGTIYGNPNPNGFSYSGGADSVWISNIGKTYDEKQYSAGYIQDDWKINPTLTLNLGVRWDYFGPINETNGGQANFVPSAFGTPTFLIPASGKDNRTLSTGGGNGTGTCQGLNCWGFVDLLARDGISLAQTNQYGKGLLKTQKTNLAPRVGFAYQATPKLVVRGGFGLFFNSFENQGYGPNIGENYPFQYSFSEGIRANTSGPAIASQVAPVSFGTPFAGCPTAGPGGTATLEAGASCISFTPALVNALGLGLQGLQFNYQTPRTYSANVTLQYAITPTLSAQASYVFTDGQNLQTGIGANHVSQIFPAGISTTQVDSNSKPLAGMVPFPDFGGGSYQDTIGNSQYHGLQTKLEKHYSSGLNFLLTYTFSKTMSDAGDLLNGGSNGGYRAPSVAGLGPRFDWGLADFNIFHVVHLSGSYNLPFGKDQRFLSHGAVANAVFGGWSINWIATLQGGQPVNFGCPTGTTSGTGCNTLKVPGVSQQLGIQNKAIAANGGIKRPFWINNAAAFNQPCKLGASGPISNSPTGCVPLSGSAALGNTGGGETFGPGFHRLDYSMFKGIQLNERFSMQFRAEFFNILNHPNFNSPGFGGNGVVSVSGANKYNDPHFGQVGSTRDAPYDPRQIQFALKLYY